MDVSNDIFSLNEAEIEIFESLRENSEIFLKLSPADRRILIWKIGRKPNLIPEWIEYVACDYAQRKEPIQIDKETLYYDVQFVRTLRIIPG